MFQKKRGDDSQGRLKYAASRILHQVPMDILFIENFRLPVSVGIYPREKAAPQVVEFALQIGVSTVKAGASDNIHDTINYAEVVDYLKTRLAEEHFNLLESLAEYVACALIERYGARDARVSVAKIGAMPGVGRVGVVIQRTGDRVPEDR
jgi:dihydroneopterin aldolase